MSGRVAVTGANGFIGTNVVQASSEQLRVLIRERHLSRRPRDRPVVGRLHDDLALSGLLDGAETLIHCANYIGPDAARAQYVNAEGTARLLEATVRAGVRRIVYLSTSGVYGNGPFVAAGESTPTVPTSPTSRTRLDAEQSVIDAGGVVVRPHLVVGAGDTRVGPVLQRAIAFAGARPAPSPKLSVITARELARQIWWVVGEAITGIVNAHHGEPVTLDRLQELLTDGREMVAPAPAATVRDRLRDAGLSTHQVNMLSAPSTFTSRLEGQLGQVRLELTEADVRWYRSASTR